MPETPKRKARIFYARVDEFWRKEEKYAYLDEKQHGGNIEWQEIKPDAKHNWLTQGMHDEFEAFTPIGTKEAKASSKPNILTVFETYGRGVATSRDSWAYNFSESELVHNVIKTIDAYNALVSVAAKASNKSKSSDDLIMYDAHEIAWSRDLKLDLERGKEAKYAEDKVREALYRPFAKSHLFFDRVLNEEVYIFPSIFPTRQAVRENRIICLTGQGSEKPFMTLASDNIVDLHLASPGCSTQCFPFYTYNEDGTNRGENITDWSLEQFRSHYKDKSIKKWDIFHYVYAVLHHPLYRERYAANLKRELPRIPFAPDFKAFADIGKRLAEIHVDYEQQPEYPLERIETPGQPLDWRVEKMKLSKDKRSLVYNDFLTLSGIPPEVFEYRLGNRSALEWIIDQYQVSTDKRSGITNDPNRTDDPEYIVRLVGQVITISNETVRSVNNLASMHLTEAN
jgi:predicted helicase